MMIRDFVIFLMVIMFAVFSMVRKGYSEETNTGGQATSSYGYQFVDENKDGINDSFDSDSLKQITNTSEQTSQFHSTPQENARGRTRHGNHGYEHKRSDSEHAHK
jgi:hypothetical protein